MNAIIDPVPVELIKAELTKSKKLQDTNKGHNELYIVTWQDSPNVVTPKHAGRPKKPYTEKAQSKAIRVIGSIADQVKTINDFIREHPYEEDRVKFLLSSVIEQLK